MTAGYPKTELSTAETWRFKRSPDGYCRTLVSTRTQLSARRSNGKHVPRRGSHPADPAVRSDHYDDIRASG